MSNDNNTVAGIQPVIAALRANPQSIRRLLVARGSQNRRVADIELMPSPGFAHKFAQNIRS